MAAVERKAVQQAAVFDDSKRLKLVIVPMFGSIEQVLLDFGAVRSVIETSLCSQLHLHLHSTNRQLKLTDRSKANDLGKGDKVPITGEAFTQALTFLVVKHAPRSLILERPSMKTIRASLDFDEDTCHFSSGEQVVTVPSCTEKIQNGRTLSKEFTSEEEDDTDKNSIEERGQESNTKEGQNGAA